jgi:hypothetical protein
MSFALESLFVRWGSYDKLYNSNSISPNVRVKVGRKQRQRNPLWVWRINYVFYGPKKKFGNLLLTSICLSACPFETSFSQWHQRLLYGTTWPILVKLNMKIPLETSSSRDSSSSTEYRIWPCHDSSGSSLATHRGSLGSISGQFMRDLRSTK